LSRLFEEVKVLRDRLSAVGEAIEDKPREEPSLQAG
jgi:hypothetical protein